VLSELSILSNFVSEIHLVFVELHLPCGQKWQIINIYANCKITKYIKYYLHHHHHHHHSSASSSPFLVVVQIILFSIMLKWRFKAKNKDNLKRKAKSKGKHKGKGKVKFTRDNYKLLNSTVCVMRLKGFDEIVRKLWVQTVRKCMNEHTKWGGERQWVPSVRPTKIFNKHTDSLI